MNDVILAINAGSSSIKFSLFYVETLNLILHGKIEDVFESPIFSSFNDKNEVILKQELNSHGYESSIKFFFEWFRQFNDKFNLIGVGHRIVHGGVEFLKPVLINDEVILKLTSLIPLAPLHQSHSIEAIKIIKQFYPNIIQVACFDTAFHRTQSHLSSHFAIPRSMTEEGMVRYGFHGLSYEYIASILHTKMDVKKNKKVIVAHLGNGSSVCALYNLKSLATSMGFTALDGLMMGTRCGTIDPGLILYLFQEKKMSVEQINHLLYNESGLLGVSGMSSDMHFLLTNKRKEAIEAIDLFCYRAAREISAFFVILKGCDAIVFTAGIGENAALVRKKICEWFDWMDIQLDEDLNNRNNSIISHVKSKVIVAVIPTDEDYMIAKHTLSLVGGSDARE